MLHLMNVMAMVIGYATVTFALAILIGSAVAVKVEQINNRNRRAAMRAGRAPITGIVEGFTTKYGADERAPGRRTP